MLIYLIKNSVNGKVYVGQTSKNSLKKRYHGLAFHKDPPNPHLASAYQKYGAENFTIEKLAECDNRDDLDKLERFYIDLFKSYDREHGYNKQFGGHQTKEYTVEIREKFSNIQKDLVENRPGWKEQLIEQSNVYWNNEENRNKKSEQMKEVCSSREKREKMSIIQGSKPFDVFRKADGVFVGSWINKAECARELNICAKNVRAVLAGRKKSVQGYICKYKDY